MPPVELPVPTLGERGDINEREMSPNALRILHNAMRDTKGRLSIRPGYLRLSDTNPGTRIMGSHYFQTTSGSLKLLAATKTGVWSYDGAAWNDISGSALTGGNLNHVRFTTFFQSGTYYAVITNGVDVIQKWDGGAGNTQTLGGTPGVSIDVTVLGNRLLCLQSPNKVRISDFNNFEVFSTDLDLLLVDSGDQLIGMQRVSRTSVAVLGQRSQWVLRAGTGNFPVRPERMSENLGPVSSAAVVKAHSKLYWLAEDGNVYIFDGSTPSVAIGWAMVPWVSDRLHDDSYPMTHGVFIENLHKIFWFFPEKGSTAPNLGIFLDVMTMEMGRLSFAVPITASTLARMPRTSLITWATAATAGYTWASNPYTTWDSVGGTGQSERVAILCDQNGVAHAYGRGSGSDDGGAISGEFEFPLKNYGPWPETHVPKVYESFFRKSSVPVLVDVAIGATDTLMSDPVYHSLPSIDLSVDQRNDIDLSSIGEKRFVSIRHRFTSDMGQVSFLGGIFDGEVTDIVKGPENND